MVIFYEQNLNFEFGTKIIFCDNNAPRYTTNVRKRSTKIMNEI